MTNSTAPRRKIVFDTESDPDFSWLEQDHYKPGHKDFSPIYPTEADMRAGTNAYDPAWYTDPANHEMLCMLVYELRGDDWELVDSLGNIDFLASEDDHDYGTFYRVSDIPATWTYQRELAKDAGLPE